MDRILFIVPPHIRFEEFVNPAFNARTVQKQQGRFGSIFTDMPLGVMALSAYLKKHLPVDTRLLDFSVELNRTDSFEHASFADFFRAVLSAPPWRDFAPELVCISTLFTTAYRSLLEIAASCREIFPEALITAGGGVPTNMYREIFRDSAVFDGLCFAEGENPLRGLVAAGEPRHFLEESPSWITAAKVAKGTTFHHDFIHDLDEIPFYDYDICDIDQYGLNPAITAYGSLEERGRNFHVMTSRGCPSRCCFCASHTVHGRAMRYYSIERVREDFRRLRDDYGARTIVFQDDHLLGNKPRAYRIIDIVKELGLTAVFQNGLALYALDRKMLEALKSAGLNQIVLAVESGSDRVLREIMHKPLDLAIVRRVADDCRQLGIYTNVNILIGLPGETRADIDDSLNFLKTIDANWFIILCATPLAGSEMLEICQEKGYLTGSYIDCDYKKPIVATEEFSPEYILERAYQLNLELNFVGNSDMRRGDWAMALKGLENAIRAKDDHVLAYHYAARCHAELGHAERAADYRRKAREYAAASPFWQRYLEMYRIDLAPEEGGVTPLAERLAAIGDELDDPRWGLPEEVFLFVSSLTPMVNVDLLIKDAVGRTLLTWRDDSYDGPGWHIPGGIVRYKESLAQRIGQVARLELGVSVEHAATPLALHEIVHPTRSVRGHFLSLLYPCTLTSEPDPGRAYRQGSPHPGAWAWHAVCPDDLIPVHDIYRPYI